ncbi:MAG: D-inositol-3-phosphate glycosyltransferase [Actinomycetota bacterium]
MLAVHTSPLEQPGTGDAGGLNVYVVQTARRLAGQGIAVEVFTRATSSALPPTVELAPGVLVRHVTAGPFEGLSKDDLPGQLCAFAAEVMRTQAARPPGYYDLIHSHYWLSGQVGWLAADRWQTPLVHTMHTMARVKNLSLADGDTPEPRGREIGEAQVVAEADRLVANTAGEAHQLVELYDADPSKVVVVNPGVDLDRFSPIEDHLVDRATLDIPADAVVLLFVGRIQPLKAPDLLIHAAAHLLADQPELRRRLVVAIVGGPSGSGLREPASLVRLARELGVADRVRFEPPAPAARLAQWYRAADLVIVPSHSESFGLVALEAQACGTPVIAADVSGLREAVADGVSGLLVVGHDSRRWAAVIADVLHRPTWLRMLSAGALAHAARFSWDNTVSGLCEVYTEAAQAVPARRQLASRRPLRVVHAPHDSTSTEVVA